MTQLTVKYRQAYRGDCMDDSWIVAANAGRARFFSKAGASAPLVEIEDMVNAAVRLPTAATEPDRIGPFAAGKSIHNVGGARPTKNYEPPTTPTRHETELFARSVASSLLYGHQQGRFRHLALIASPEFLGILRTLLDPQLAPLVTLQIDKDYTQLGAAQLLEQIRAHQQSPAG